ncbi:MAG: hypothetical protein D8M59_14090 [Planctomycetes bacterium]|nr:hypothetical protein [Planctomycetota bacterium]NOG55638.1 hypothetical protein [Planctomycetota bacterium]
MLLKSLTTNWLQSKTVVWAGSTVVCCALIVTSVLIIREIITTPPPDVWGDEVPEVANFLFDEDFGELPAKERLSLLVEMAKRFNQFSQEDAAELAMLLGEMNRNMREQIEENMRQLVADYMAESAAEYENIPPEQREDFLREFILYFDKLGDEINGRESTRTDEDRMERMQRQASRDKDRAKENMGPVNARGVEMMLNFYNSDVTSRTGAVQRGQIGRMMRDITRFMRDEPLDGGGGG